MNPTKNQGELRCSGMVSSSRSTSGTRRAALANVRPYRVHILSFGLVLKVPNINTLVL